MKITELDVGEEYSLLMIEHEVRKEYCVAWLYSRDTQTWAQGYYFDEIISAVLFYQFRERNRLYYDRMKQILLKAIYTLHKEYELDEIMEMLQLNDEEVKNLIGDRKE